MSAKTRRFLAYCLCAVLAAFISFWVYDLRHTTTPTADNNTTSSVEPSAQGVVGNEVQIEAAPAQVVPVVVEEPKVVIIEERPAKFSMARSVSNQPAIVTEQQVRDMQEFARKKQLRNQLTSSANPPQVYKTPSGLQQSANQ